MPKTLTLIPRHVIESALGEAEYDEIRKSYSGRGMYGGSCFGVVVHSQRDVNILLFGLGYECRDLEESDSSEYEQLAESLHRMARVAQVDSMGTDIIVYFPGFALGD